MSQLSPGLQELPVQHICSRSPQAAGVVHTSPTHAREPEQLAPGQHGCMSPPHARHIPVVQVNPAWQMSPAQQAWALPPHAVGVAWHWPPTHAVPSQHSALDSQRPPEAWQQRPPVQLMPSQQSLGPAQAAEGSEQHAPSRQSSPRSQAVPPQHRCVAWPQRPGSGAASMSGTSEDGGVKSSTKRGMSFLPPPRPASSEARPPAHAKSE